jgi:hypothetical protein
MHSCFSLIYFPYLCLTKTIYVLILLCWLVLAGEPSQAISNNFFKAINVLKLHKYFLIRYYLKIEKTKIVEIYILKS